MLKRTEAITILRRSKAMKHLPPKSKEDSLKDEKRRFKLAMKGKQDSFNDSDMNNDNDELSRQMDDDMAREIAELQRQEQRRQERQEQKSYE